MNRELQRRLTRLEGANAGDRMRYVVSARLTSYEDRESSAADNMREMTAGEWEAEYGAPVLLN